MQNEHTTPQGSDLRAYATQAWDRAQKARERGRARNAAHIRRALESLNRLQRTIEQHRTEVQDAAPDP